METQEKSIKVYYQEAYVSTMFLSVNFNYNDEELTATARYFNDSGLEDIEVYCTGDMGITFNDTDDEYQQGRYLLENMDLDKHLTL